MPQETIDKSNGSDIGKAYFVTQRVVASALSLGAAFLVLSAVLPSTKPKTVANLIKQFKGEAHYWKASGEKAGVFDCIVVRAFRTNSKITAARSLGEMGPEAVEAVPALVEALESGPNDIDTGDGCLPYRSTIAIALGKIGDARAIGPLTEKLKVKEKATFGSGYSGGTFPYQPTGVGHHAIVEALGMFGADAKSAVPFIRALEDTDDYRLRQTIKRSIAQIENSE